MPGVALREISIYCTDLEKTREFYEAIGIELHKISAEWTHRYYYKAILQNSLSLEIRLIENDKIYNNGLKFWIDSVPETLKRLSAIGIKIVAPHKAVRHLDIYRAVVLDPDGRRVDLWNKNNLLYPYKTS
jgi:predicted enzyme related to lactoylglutathione lyase